MTRSLDPFSWAVGLIEGEGWFGLVRASKHVGQYTYPRVTVQSTDEDTIIRLRLALGCGNVSGPRIPKDPNRKPYWAWSIAGSGAREVITDMLPHLGERRRARAMEILAQPQLNHMVEQLELVETP